ncbi:hypothetical protein CI109_104897 [Kwoniella shandongensis]|uniref:adrenodoxin-NADP(+) reductase n=1 Tax=Kwoniella shandongensis TaxID=1734106 RepID=A0A5M6BU15_9TREE|nr:uncharacterized protein CI109_006616 [Kwoniella shandongensis]KAA5525065.1 hypothetical protein CI109_006616 [Kwoniella shandongensis]
MIPRPASLRLGLRLRPQCQRLPHSSLSHRLLSSSTSPPPLKLAIIGSGPSGFYTASRILSTLPADTPNGQNVEVHMYERLPTPYGLVRYGVAPDHPEVKNCQHKFDELSSDPRFKYFGNVLLSSQPSTSPFSPSPSTSLSPYTYPHALRVSFDEILPYYSTLVLTYGASLSNPLSSVPGSSSSSTPLEGVFPALALVSWYNSHPAFVDLPIDLSQVEEVSVIGQGNVALDVARILLKPVESLRHTDLSEQVLDTLSKSRVKNVRVVGRRGPGQVAFTTKEFREMLSIPGVRYGGIGDKGLLDEAKAQVGNERMRKRLLGLMDTTREEGDKSFILDFLKSPKAFLPSLTSNERVGEVEWNLNQLLNSTPIDPTAITPTPPASQAPSTPSGGQVIARPTGETVRDRAELVVESVGYRSEPLTGEEGMTEGSWKLPFDSERGRVRNISGRVVDEDGVAVPGVYAAGWAARGPVGVIASTMHDAYSLSSLILDDHFASTSSPSSTAASSTSASIALTPGPMNSSPQPGVPDAILNAKRDGKIVVDLEGWSRIDGAERERAKRLGSGKEREKFRRVEEMLSVLG